MQTRIPPIRLTLALALFVVSVLAFDRLFSLGFDLVQASAVASASAELRNKLEGLPDKGDYQLLILGTSRTLEAVHPAYIRRTLGITSYKEANQGKGPRYNYEFYQIYERIIGRPRWVVYGVDYFMFNMASEKWALARVGKTADDPAPETRWTGRLLRTWTEKAADDRAILAQIARAQSWLERVRQRLGRRSEAPHTFDPEHRAEDMESYTGGPSGTLNAVRPASYAKIPFGTFPGAEGTYFLKLLEQWEREGVAVALIDTPDWIGTWETNYQRRQFVDYFTGLVAGHANRAFIDYSEPRRFPLAEATYFADGGYGNTNSHLSKRGAEQFARVFLPDLKRFVETHPGR